MFAKTIIDSDAFIDMPVTARLLYYDLAMRADDDGFVNSPRKIMRMIGASDEDLEVLVSKKFILRFDNGVVVIKHWFIHNYIRKDTYRRTPYTEEYSQLELDEKNAYKFKAETERGRAVDEPSTQIKSNQIKLNKNNQIYQDSNTSNSYTIGPRESICDRLTDNQFKLLDDTYEDFVGLIDLIDGRLRLSQEEIRSPYAYIISVARSERWAIKP